MMLPHSMLSFFFKIFKTCIIWRVVPDLKKMIIKHHNLYLWFACCPKQNVDQFFLRQYWLQKTNCFSSSSSCKLFAKSFFCPLWLSSALCFDKFSFFSEGFNFSDFFCLQLYLLIQQTQRKTVSVVSFLLANIFVLVCQSEKNLYFLPFFNHRGYVFNYFILHCV